MNIYINIPIIYISLIPPSPDGVYTLIHCRDKKLSCIMGVSHGNAKCCKGEYSYSICIYICILDMYISYVFADSLLICT